MDNTDKVFVSNFPNNGYTNKGFIGEDDLPREKLETKDSMCEKEYDDIGNSKNIWRYRMARTVYLVTCWMGFGFMVSIVGPTLPDLLTRVDITYTQNGLVGTLSSLISLVSAFAMGAIVDRFKHYMDLIFGAGMFVSGLVFFAKGYTTQMWVYTLISIVFSFSTSGMNAVGDCLIMSTWGAKGSGPIHALHFGFSFGMTFGPFACIPFLSPESNATTNTTSLDYPIDALDEGPDVYRTYLDDSQIEIPHAITGGLFMALSIGSVLFYFIRPPKGFKWQGVESKSIKEVFQCGKTDIKTTFLIPMLIMIALFYFLNQARENTLFNYVFTYAVKSDHKLTNSEAALLDGAFKISFMLGRLIFIFIAHFVIIQPLLVSEIILVAIASIGLAVFGPSNLIILYICVCLIGLCMAPIWPGGVAWTDQYIPITAMVLAINQFGSSVAVFFFSWFNGYLLDNTHPDALLYSLMVIGIALAVLMIIMQLVAYRYGTRFSRVSDLDVDIDNQSDTKIVIHNTDRSETRCANENEKSSMDFSIQDKSHEFTYL